MRGIDSIVFYYICTVTGIKVESIVIHVAAAYGITPDRYTIIVLEINTVVGIGKGVAADLQTRGQAAAIITV